MGGWIKLHRKITDSILFSEDRVFSRFEAWVDMLLLANHSESEFLKKGQIIKIERGQLGRSEVELSSRWGWSRGKVRTFLKLLENEQQIEQQKNNVTTVITITNYDKYQGDEHQTEQQKDTKPNSKKTHYKNVKNDKNEKNKEYTSDFEGFWEVYGRKGNKAKAFACWAKLNSDDIEIIRQRLPAYLYKTRNDLTYRKDAQTYLNPTARHFEDVVYISEKQEAKQDDIF